MLSLLRTSAIEQEDSAEASSGAIGLAIVEVCRACMGYPMHKETLDAPLRAYLPLWRTPMTVSLCSPSSGSQDGQAGQDTPRRKKCC
jgi:hypothetical protein